MDIFSLTSEEQKNYIETLDVTQQHKVLELLIAHDKAQCEKSYYHFFKQSWKTLEPDTPLVPNWHYEYLCDELQKQAIRIMNREPKKYDLIINVMPRSAKSTMGTIAYNPWVWTINPAEKFVTASYGSDLSTDHAVSSRRLIQSDWYQQRWSNKFSLTTDQNVKTNFHNDKRGYRMSTSVEAGVLGRGGNIIVIDDPVDSAKTVSDLILNNCIRWYDKVMYSRLNDQKVGIRIIIMQRLHENDLTGYLIENRPSKYKLICIPGELSEDATYEIRHHYKNGLFFPGRADESVLAGYKESLGNDYSGQIQQRPTPEEGGLFKRKFWNEYEDKDLPQYFDEVIQAWDMTFKDLDANDFVVGQVWGRIGMKKYLIDMVRQKLDFPGTLAAVKDLYQEYPSTSAIFVEDKANGPAVISVLKNEIPAIIPVNPDRNKVTRAMPAVRQLQSGNLYIPKNKPWYNDFINECSNFPNARHDDIVDTVSMAVNELTYQKRVISAYTSSCQKDFKGSRGESFSVLIILKNMDLQGLCFTWNTVEKKLYIDDEIMLITDLTKTCKNVYGSERMFKEGKDTAHWLRKQKIMVKPNFMHEENGAILTLNKMMSENMIVVHDKCRELDTRLKTWNIKGVSPDPNGRGIIEALLIAISILRQKRQLEKPKPVKRAYGSQREQTRSKTIGKGIQVSLDWMK